MVLLWLFFKKIYIEVFMDEMIHGIAFKNTSGGLPWWRNG